MEPTVADREAAAISVVVPTHNRAELLAQTLRSIEEQTLRPAEVIVVDDASTDSTGDVVARSGATAIRNDGPPWGPARARNAGLARASARFVAFVDSDDLLRPRALETLSGALLADRDAPFAFGTALAARRDADGWHVDGLIAADDHELEDPLCSIYVRNSVPSPAALVRIEDASVIGGYDARVRWAEDQHFWVRLAQRGRPAHVPSVVAIYRLHDAGRHYTPALDSTAVDPFAHLAEADDRLARCAPQRRGVQLAEIAAGALRSGHLPRAAAAARNALAPTSGRRSVVRRALRHRRDRRRWRAAGQQVWESSPELRSWLATY